jgi:hypothetical protein
MDDLICCAECLELVDCEDIICEKDSMICIECFVKTIIA